MTIKIALTGKSGSGKTTILKAFSKTLTEEFSEKSILLLDNDLTCDLAQTFSLDIRKTIYGIRSGKHEYRTGIPEKLKFNNPSCIPLNSAAIFINPNCRPFIFSA